MQASACFLDTSSRPQTHNPFGPLWMIMESVRLPFKQDDFGNDVFARVSWQKHETQSYEPKPIGKLDTRPIPF